MKFKTTKNLIIFGAIVLSFIVANDASAYCKMYAFSSTKVDPNCVDNPSEHFGYVPYSNTPVSTASNNTSSNSNTKATTSGTTIINNYYYGTAPASTTKTTTNTNNVQKNTSENSEENIDGPASVSGSDITALSLRGSGSFMPSSIWQWMLVVILILIIIVISRMLVRKPHPSDHDSHAVHAH